MMEYSFLHNPFIKVSDLKKSFRSEATLFDVLRRLVKQGRIVKLKGGLYATVNPLHEDIYVGRFEIATTLYEGAYCAYHTALEYHGLATQVYNDVHVVTKNRHSPMLIDGLEYQFFQSTCDHGILEEKKNALIRVTDLERTVADCLDKMLLSGGIEEVFAALSAMERCDETKLLTYLFDYRKKILFKKAGYFFSLLKPKYLSDEFYRTCRKNMSFTDDFVIQNRKNSSIYSSEWRLYVPEWLPKEEKGDDRFIG